MASYPAAVWAPTTKNPGDKIASAHIDDIQNEIIAIEDGLLNSKAPLNSSNATVNTLSVAAGSTFVGSAVFSSNVTLSTGTLTIAPGKRFACVLSHSAIQNVNSAAATGLNFDTEISNNGALHSTVSNSSRILFPVLGTYLIGANVTWSAGSTAGSYRSLQVKLNDLTNLPPAQQAPNPSAAQPSAQCVVTLYQPASTTEYATIIVQQDSGSTMSISTGAVGIRAFASLIGV